MRFVWSVVLLSIPFLVYSQNECTQIFEGDKSKEVFIYQSTTDSILFAVEELLIDNDKIYRTSFDLKFNTATKEAITYIQDNYLKLLQEVVPRYRLSQDTFLIVSQTRIDKMNGESFIDLEAPNLNEDRPPLDNIYLNHTIWLEELDEIDDCEFYTFTYLNVFSSDTQYSYKYLKGGWIVEYNFGEGFRFVLVNE